MKNRVAALICFALGSPWVAMGAYHAIHQHHTNRDARETTGTVLSSGVRITHDYDDRRGRTETVYHADIAFEYEVDERAYRSRRLGHSWEPTGEARVMELVRAHPASRPVTVYYLPARPAEGFLLREYHFFYYLLTFGGLSFVLMSIAIATGTAQGRGDPEPPPRRKSIVYALIAVGWYAAVAFTIVHFCVIARQPLNAWRIIGLAVVALLGLIPAMGAWRAYKRAAAPREFAPRWE